MASDLSDIGSHVRERRRARRISQSELAHLAGVSRPQIDRLENARLPEIGFNYLLRILHVLGLDLRITELNHKRPTLDDLRAEDT